jgi:hypothetical protein
VGDHLCKGRNKGKLQGTEKNGKQKERIRSIKRQVKEKKKVGEGKNRGNGR